MKVLAAILILVACVAADDEWTVKSSAEILQIFTECKKGTALSTEQLAKLNNVEYPNEPEIRQYVLCSTEKLGIFSPHEGYHPDRIAKQFKMDMTEEEVKKISEDCIAKFPKGDKPNDVLAYEVKICLMDSAVGQKVKSFIKKLQETTH